MMKPLIAATLLFAGFAALTPTATATPCDVGDTDTVCLNDYNYAYNTCSDPSAGYESHETQASATANGESVAAGGYNSCYTFTFFGGTCSGNDEGAYVNHFGSQGDASVGVYGYSYDSDGACPTSSACETYGYTDETGTIFSQDLDPAVCDAMAGLPWGDLVP